MTNREDADELYRVKIQTAASPQEVAALCDLLEESGYGLITDMNVGELAVVEGDIDE